MRDLAVFDLCGTLFQCNLLFAFVSRQAECVRGVRFANGVAAKAVDALLPSIEFRRRIYARAWAQIPEGELQTRAACFVRDVLPGMRNEQAFAALETRRAAGDRIVLLSAAPEIIVAEIAKAVGADDFMGARFRSGRIEDDTRGKKHERIAVFAPYGRLFVCTDNKSDLRLLQMADEARILCRKKRLAWWTRRFPALTIWEARAPEGRR